MENKERKVSTYDYQLPTWALCPIFNGDYSEISEAEKAKLDRFLASNQEELGIGHWSIGNGSMTQLQAYDASKCFCAVDSATGIYSPMHFAKKYTTYIEKAIAGNKSMLEDFKILRHGPYCAYYAEAWDNFVEDLEILDDAGNKQRILLGESGDIFLIHSDVNLCEDEPEEYFSHSNDIDSVGGNVMDMQYVVFITK